MLIDTHCHLNDERLASQVADIVADFEKDNIWAAINAAYDRESAEIGVEFAEKYDKVFATVGIHPHDAKNATIDDYERFFELSKQKKVVAVGEIGLDFFYDHSPRDVQKEVFEAQLDMAHAAKLPVVLHVRDAYGEALDILKNNKSLLQNGVLLHCYGGSAEMVKEFLRLGCSFSFGGAITFKNARRNIESLLACPNDKFMLETDCPYMTPVPNRGQTNYPKYISLVAEKAAEIKGCSVNEIEQMTNKNACDFFTKLQT